MAFTIKKDYEKGEREAEWSYKQRTVHGLNTIDPLMPPQQQSTCREFSELIEQARKRAEIARFVSSIMLT
jgi:H+-transporting ATPase